MTELIASYYESRFEGRRRFDLHDDHLLVVGKETFGNAYEGRVDLADLAPEPEWFRERSRYFATALAWAVLSLVAHVVLLQGFDQLWSDRGPMMALVSAIVGTGMCVATARRVEFVRFRDVDGQPVLEIARPRGGGEKFEGFVEALASGAGK